MKAPHDPRQGGLTLQIKLGDSINMAVDGKSVRISVFEITRGYVRLTFKADPEIQISRPVREERKMHS